MLKSGDIVLQEYTMINNKNFKDNKEVRLSVVLFSVEIDDTSYVCTCPITNSYNNARKHPEKYYYSDFLVLNPKKLCCVKIDSANLYDVNTVHSVSIRLSDNHMEGIFNKINNFPEDNKEAQFFGFVRENIQIVQKNMISEKKRAKKHAKKQAILLKKR